MIFEWEVIVKTVKTRIFWTTDSECRFKFLIWSIFASKIWLFPLQGAQLALPNKLSNILEYRILVRWLRKSNQIFDPTQLGPSIQLFHLPKEPNWFCWNNWTQYQEYRGESWTEPFQREIENVGSVHKNKKIAIFTFFSWHWKFLINNTKRFHPNKKEKNKALHFLHFTCWCSNCRFYDTKIFHSNKSNKERKNRFHILSTDVGIKTQWYKNDSIHRSKKKKSLLTFKVLIRGTKIFHPGKFERKKKVQNADSETTS